MARPNNDISSTSLDRQPAGEAPSKAGRGEAFPARTLGGLQHKLAVLLVLLAAFYGLFFAQNLLWQHGRPAASLFEQVVFLLTFIWVSPLVPSLIACVGMLLHPRASAQPASPMGILVCYRIVSRGQNAGVLSETVQSIRDQMQRMPLYPYRIEVVTDLPVDLPDSRDLTHLLVPESFQPRRGARFKARALEYARRASDLPSNAWILHLDEESRITLSLIWGVRKAVLEEEKSGRHRIGQGAILYHRNLRRNPILTLADSLRTGDDLGRFHLQHRLGVTLFGLHGSFILVRNSVEKQSTFDVGPAGSITEDAWWALVQMDRGRRCRWVDGYVVEQSPETIRDFIKQRRRWFVGLCKCVLHAPTRLRFRLPLAFTIFIWSISWLGVLAMYLDLAAGQSTLFSVRLIGNFAFAAYISSYTFGLKMNLDNLQLLRGWKRPLRLLLYLAQVVLIPFFSIIEALGVIYGLLSPERGFHVIKKPHQKAVVPSYVWVHVRAAAAVACLLIGVLVLSHLPPTSPVNQAVAKLPITNLIAAAAPGPTVSPTPQPSANPIQKGLSAQDFQGGLMLYVDSATGGREDLRWSSRQLFTRLAGLGANSLGIAFPVFQSGVTASTVYADPQQTPTTETLATIVDEAHREHLAVMLRPILDEQSLEDAQGDWRGTIQPSDRGRWFATYSALLVQYAEMADAHQVEYFDVGTELNSLQRETEHWHEVISSMRSVYSGRITYSVNFDFRGVGFADTLDFIGLDAYFPLHAPEVATVDEMQQAWAEWTPALRGLAATTGRPVVLTELGARSTPGAHIKPLVWYTQAPPDPEEQARYYQASCNALFPVVTGFYWWMVTFDSPYPNAIQDTSYDPLGKPAEQEIRNCFVSHAAGANPLRAH